MDKITKINCEYNLICRICLIKAENSKILNFKMFEYCTGISTKETSHSTQICLQCETSLNDFCIFKEKCIESHKSLMEIYSENEESINSSNNFTDSNSLFLIEKREETEHDSENGNTSNCEESLDSFDNFTEPNTLFLIENLEDTEENQNELQEQPNMDQNDSEDDTNIVVSKTDKTKKKVKKPKKKEFGLCTYCGNSYSKLHLNSHIRNVHSKSKPTTEKTYDCNQCEKSYKSTEGLTIHKRVVHEKIKFYVCNICNESFAYWKRYKSHLVSAHNAPAKFSCDICDYKTQESYKLVVHKRQHTGERPFHCKQCPKEFSRARQLLCHMVTHSKEKNLICEICSKAFAASRYLTAHMKTHTKERNYVCPDESCGMSFIQNRVMQKHIRSSHPEIEIPPPGTIVTKKNALKQK